MAGAVSCSMKRVAEGVIPSSLEISSGGAKVSECLEEAFEVFSTDQGTLGALFPKACIDCAGTDEGAGAMADVARGGNTEAAALAALQAEVAGLRQSLALMLETQDTHTEMLRRLLEAAAAPTRPETALSDALTRIAGILTRQTEGLAAIQSVLLRLPEDVGQAVAAGVREALSRG
jgi:hypothetical protein